MTGATCRTCGRTWGGTEEGHCGVCHLQFKSASAFDRHRVGEYAGVGGHNTRRCLTPEELTKPRERSGKPTLIPVTVNGATYWVTSLRNGLVKAQEAES